MSLTIITDCFLTRDSHNVVDFSFSSYLAAFSKIFDFALSSAKTKFDVLPFYVIEPNYHYELQLFTHLLTKHRMIWTFLFSF